MDRPKGSKHCEVYRVDRRPPLDPALHGPHLLFSALYRASASFRILFDRPLISPKIEDEQPSLHCVVG